VHIQKPDSSQKANQRRRILEPGSEPVRQEKPDESELFFETRFFDPLVCAGKQALVTKTLRSQNERALQKVLT